MIVTQKFLMRQQGKDDKRHSGITKIAEWVSDNANGAMAMVDINTSRNQKENIIDGLGGIERAGYSVVEVAAMFGISAWNIRMAIKQGEIRTLRFGRRLIVPRSEIERLSR